MSYRSSLFRVFYCSRRRTIGHMNEGEEERTRFLMTKKATIAIINKKVTFTNKKFTISYTNILLLFLFNISLLEALLTSPPSA